jgi:hypothetical protein
MIQGKLELNRRFYARSTVPLMAAVALCVIAFALGVSLPTIAANRSNLRRDHITQAQAVADSVIRYVDSEITKMLGAVDLLHGFAASAAPLQIPDYFADNASRRVATTLRSGTPGALSEPGFLRVRNHVSKSFVGFRSAVVQPGIVNVFSVTGKNFSGSDQLNNGPPGAGDEYFFMVQTTRDVVRGPLPGVPGVINLIVRSPIFSDPRALIRNNATVRDPITGHHPNWKYLWGTATLAMDVVDLSRDNNTLAELVGLDFHYLFEALPSDARFLPTNYMVIANSTDPILFDHTVRDCSEIPEFQVLCVRIMPRNLRWAGDDVNRAIAAATIGGVLGSIAFVVIGLIILRILIGPKRNPIQHAPLKLPFYGMCVDMVSAHELWGEVPFVMAEVTSTFDRQLEMLADQHQVYIATRLGNTALVVATTRERILKFSRAMLAWSLKANWPAAVTSHCSSTDLQFSFILHACKDAQIQMDAAATQVDVSGHDIQTLLLLRVAGLPGHLLCTSEFMERDPHKSSSIKEHGVISFNSASISVDAQTHGLGPSHNLGDCFVPLMNDDGNHTIRRVHGRLLASASTEGRSLTAIVDALPDWVWGEWRPSEEYAEERCSSNPLRAPESDAGGERLQHSRRDDASEHSLQSEDENTTARAAESMLSTMALRSRTVSVGVATRAVTRSHMANGEADVMLSGSAVSVDDIRVLAQLLIPFIASARMLETSSDFSASSDMLKGLELHLRFALSMASYFLVAYRTLLAPINADSQAAIMTRVCSAFGIPNSDGFMYALAARCARVCHEQHGREHLEQL